MYMMKLLTAIALAIVLAAPSLQAEELGPPEVPPLNLELPEPITLEAGYIVPEGLVYIAFTVPQYGTILQIGTGYKLWTKNYPLRTKLDELWNLRLEVVHERLAVCHDSKEVLSEDREYAYDLFYSEVEAASKAEIRSTLKTALWTGGGVLVGIAGGIIIGVLVVK